MKSATLIQCPLCHLHDHKTRHHFEPVSLRRARHAAYLAIGHAPPKETPKTVLLCRPCHDALHFLFTHQELATQFNSLRLIEGAPEVRLWVLQRRQNPAFRLSAKTHRVLQAERAEAMRRVVHLKQAGFTARWRQIPPWRCRSQKCQQMNPGAAMTCEGCRRANPSSFMAGYSPTMRNASLHYGGNRTISVRFAGRTVGGSPVIVQLWDGAKWDDCNDTLVVAALTELMRHAPTAPQDPAEVR